MIDRIRLLFLCLGFVVFFGFPSYSQVLQTHQYDVYRQDVYLYSIFFSVNQSKFKGQDVIGIFTRLEGNKISEENVVYLSPSLETKYIFQHSINDLESSYYSWEILNDSPPSKVYYYDFESGRYLSDTFVFPQNGYSIQALLYLVQQDSYFIDKTMDYNLLVPPKQFISVGGRVTSIETIEVNGLFYKCYKLEFRLQGWIGFFAPKMTYWLSYEKPHIPIIYEERGNTVYWVPPTFRKEKVVKPHFSAFKEALTPL